LKIVQVTPYFLPRKNIKVKDKKSFEFFGGAETLVYNFSKALINKNHKVTIYTLNYESNKYEQITYNNIVIKFFPNIKIGKVAISFRLLTSIMKEKDSIFHSVHVGHPLTFLTAIICRLIGRPFFVTHTGTRKFLPFSVITSKISSKIIVATKFSKNFYKSIRSEYNTVIIPHGIDTNKFSTSYKNNIIRGKIVNKNDFIVLFVGRLRWHKGVEYLIKSFSIISDKIKDIQLCIVGDGEERKRLEIYAERKKLKNRIHFLGYVPSYSLPSIYAESDLFVLPSITSDTRGHKSPEPEAFGIVLIEAMASGLPVIATKVGGLPYVVQDGKNGFLIDEKDYQELANKITILKNNKKIRKKMSENALSTVRRYYRWDEISEKYLNLFSKVK
jgi:glycosyltransferase involved in cell wall biosynthesis